MSTKEYIVYRRNSTGEVWVSHKARWEFWVCGKMTEGLTLLAEGLTYKQAEQMVKLAKDKR